ncbi:MAG: DegT/DnrJ/EryC1/StrS family aminotransferase [Armatimonadota bacterium]
MAGHMLTLIPYRAMIVNDEMRRKALAILETGISYGGEETQRFELELAAWCGTRYGVAANSGTSVMLLTLDALGIGRGDEVIMAANAYVGVLSAVIKAGATPVFVEAEAGTANIRCDGIAAAVTARTRAVMPQHTYGFPCDMDPINDVARRHNLYVLEDAAHALGAEYKGRSAGSLGQVGFHSFSGKMITVFGSGGAAVTDDRRLAENLASLRDQGRERAEDLSFIRRRDGAWYDLRSIGYNMHMTEISAGLGRIQLRLLGEFLSHRRRAAGYYAGRFRDAALPLNLPPERPWASPSYLHYVVWTPRRDALRAFLRDDGVEASIHYPAPLHLLSPVRELCGTRPGQFPEAERLCRENLSLPVGPHMTEAMLERVADGVVAFFRQSQP